MRRAVRLALAWVGVIVVVMLVAVSGVGGREGGVWVAAVIVGLAAGALAHWASRGVIKLERTRAAALGGLFLGLALGAWVGLGSPPSHGRVARAYTDLTMPAGLSLVATENRGNAMCIDDCPSVMRTYRTAQAGIVVVDGVRSSLRAQGYVLSDGFTDGDGNTNFDARRGRRTVVVVVVAEPSATTVRMLLALS